MLATLGINIKQYKKRNSTIGILVDYSNGTVVEKISRPNADRQNVFWR